MVGFEGDWLRTTMLDAVKRGRNDLNCSGDFPVEKEISKPL
jgi:hypothetical protein